MYCKNCGLLMPKNARFCTECGTLNAATNKMPETNDQKESLPVFPTQYPQPVQQPYTEQYNSSVHQEPKYQHTAPTIQHQLVQNEITVQQGQSYQYNSPKQQKNKDKRKKKKPSGCLIVFLIISLILVLIGILVLNSILPEGTTGISGNQQVQPPYSEPVASTPLREELGGTYVPNKEDYRFDDVYTDFGYVDHVLLVFFQPDVSDSEVQRVAALVNGELIGCIDPIDCFELRVPVSGKAALDELCEILLKEKSVIDAKTDSIDKLSSLSWSDPYLEDVVPDDPWSEKAWLFPSIQNKILQQWSMLFPRGNNWYQELIGAPSAWAYSDYFSQISVGVFDGGFDEEHSDLQITVANPNGNKGNINHGTHVAGIIGATRGNGTGINGILSGPYTLHGYSVQDLESESERLAGIVLLLGLDCKVVNYSIGTDWNKPLEIDGNEYPRISENNTPLYYPDGSVIGEEYPEEHWDDLGVNAAKDVLIFLEAYGPDFLIVKSAGNCGIDTRYGGWICSITRECAERAVQERPGTIYTADDIMNAIIIVGAVEQNDDYGSITISDSGEIDYNRNLELTDFSNYGSQVTISAPGSNIYSTIQNDYANMSGTSMAAPIVSACAAQLWSVDLTQTAGDVKERLLETAIVGVGATSSFDNEERTYRMVNLKAAVESLLLERGLISETRPDGDLRRLINEYVLIRIEEGELELQDIGMRFIDKFMSSDFTTAFKTLREGTKLANTLAIYTIIYILSEMFLPDGSFNVLTEVLQCGANFNIFINTFRH